MSKLLQFAAGVLCVGVLALGFLAFNRACQRTYHPPEEPGLRSTMADEVARREQLDQVEEALLRRAEAKRHLAEEVIAGRLSLAEAIEQLVALDRQWFELSTWIKQPEERLMSLQEWSGRELFRYVQFVLADHPDEAAVVIGRLKKELQQFLAERKKSPHSLASSRTEEGSR
jgi:hypothetical protein